MKHLTIIDIIGIILMVICLVISIAEQNLQGICGWVSCILWTFRCLKSENQ